MALEVCWWGMGTKKTLVNMSWPFCTDLRTSALVIRCPGPAMKDLQSHGPLKNETEDCQFYVSDTALNRRIPPYEPGPVPGFSNLTVACVVIKRQL